MSSASGALVGRMTSGGSGVTFTSDEDDEDFNLVLPEIDEEFLDDAYFTNDMRRDVPRNIPFASIHCEHPESAHCFLPAQKITANITAVERLLSSTIFNRYVYVIEMTHGDFQWTLRRRYKHFHQLHSALMLSSAKLSIPLPSRDQRRHQEQRRKFREQRHHVPRFPRRPEALLRQEEVAVRQRIFEIYLQKILRCEQFRNNPALLRFFEVSRLSFVNQLGRKRLESLVRKRSGGRRVHTSCCCSPSCLYTLTWRKRWLLLKDTFVTYLRPSDGQLCDVILMDRDFRVTCEPAETGNSSSLLVSNLTRNLLLGCWTAHQALNWKQTMEEAAATSGRDFTQPNPHGSFAPRRDDNYVTWFVDGASYMSAAADAMETAREEIFITDWWLSPEVYMKRPITEGEKWRLDKILERRAAAGVKIFILLYKEMEFALGINSFYTKQALLKLHPTNIKVLRHPDGFHRWSHHEKCIVIDQRIAFLGGIDLCYGRWDSMSHRLTDLGSLGVIDYPSLTTEPDDDGGQVDGGDHATTADVCLPRFVIDESGDSPDVIPDHAPVRFSLENGASRSAEDVTRSGEHASRSTENASQSADGRSASNDASPTRRHLWRTDRPPGGRGVAFQRAGCPQPAAHDRLRRSASSESSLDASVALELDAERRLVLSSEERARLAHSVLCACVVLDERTLRQHDTCDVCDGSAWRSDDGASNVTDSTRLTDTADSAGATDAAGVTDGGGVTDTSRVTDAIGVTDTAGVTDTIVNGVTDVAGVTDADDVTNTENIAATAIVTDTTRVTDTIPVTDTTGVTDSITVNGSSAMDGTTGMTDSSLTDAIGAMDIADATDASRVTSQPADDRSEATSAKRIQLTIDTHLTPDASVTADMTRLRPINRQASRRISTLSCFTDEEPRPFREYLRDMPTVSMATAGWSATPDVRPAPVYNNNVYRKSISVPTPQPEIRRRFWKKKSLSRDDGLSASSGGLEMKHEDGLQSLFPPLAILPKPTTPQPTRSRAFRYALHKDIRGKLHRRQSKTLNINAASWWQEREQIVLRGADLQPPSPIDMLQVLGLKGSTKLWVGKDYVNFIIKDFVDLDQPFTDFIDRLTTPRMPWHDIGIVLYGRSARDVARHFIQRWNFTKLQKRKTNADYPLLLPKSYDHCYVPEQIMKSAFCCNCQVLRSVCEWSAGISHVETSIHQAYIHLIDEAKHYIYIENQFFISTASDEDQIENQIASAICRRILAAHSAGELFRVYVVMPLLPAFEGELGTSRGSAIQAVLHWNYQSISRGGRSMLELLAAHIPDPFEYISFYGLRTHDELLDNLTTELVYVHSKLLIVDDTHVICGSANINDRSMLGRRDSELATLVEDTRTYASRMAGRPYAAGRHAGSLRCALFREHLGLLDTSSDAANDAVADAVADPVCAEFYKGVWMKQASINTVIYEKVFNCIPNDDVTSFQLLHQYQKRPTLAQTDPSEARRLLDRVKGHLVLLPLQFLATENLLPTIATKEGLIPSDIWM